MDEKFNKLCLFGGQILRRKVENVKFRSRGEHFNTPNIPLPFVLF